MTGEAAYVHSASATRIGPADFLRRGVEWLQIATLRRKSRRIRRVGLAVAYVRNRTTSVFIERAVDLSKLQYLVRGIIPYRSGIHQTGASPDTAVRGAFSQRRPLQCLILEFLVDM